MPRRRKYFKGLFKVKLKKKTVTSLVGLAFILAAGIILLSLIGVSQPIGLIADQIYKFLGFVTPLLIIAFAITVVYLLRIRSSLVTANTVAGFYLFLLSVLSLATILSPARGGVGGRLREGVTRSLFLPPKGWETVKKLKMGWRLPQLCQAHR